MTDHSHAATSVGVGIAVLGTAVGDYALQFAGLLVTLVVAWFNFQAKKSTDRKAELDRLELRHERDRSDFYLRKCARQETELVQLRHQPTAITPPFPPGESATDA